MFKKFVLFAMVVVVLVSLCACGSNTTNTATKTVTFDGETYPIQKGQTLTFYEGQYVITKMDITQYKSYAYTQYWVAIEGDDVCALIRVDAEQYVRWNVGDIIEGSFTIDSASTKRFNVDGNEFIIEWQGNK